MSTQPRVLRVALLALLGLAACAGTTVQRRAGVLEFLYPEGKDAAPPTDVVIRLPVRVGIAFVPQTDAFRRPLDAVEERGLLDRVAAAFRGTEGIERIEVVPSSYLRPAGGFENLEQVRALFGVDVMALVSYDQAQVDELNKASITYWTIVGAYVIPGNEQRTSTFVDTAVFDVASRALLFNASGRSSVSESSTAVDSERVLREARLAGFERAIDEMIANLTLGLAAFREQAKTGTVRGAGTPAVSISAGPNGSAPGGGVGAGAVGPLELLAIVAAGGAAMLRRGSA